MLSSGTGRRRSATLLMSVCVCSGEKEDKTNTPLSVNLLRLYPEYMYEIVPIVLADLPLYM